MTPRERSAGLAAGVLALGCVLARAEEPPEPSYREMSVAMQMDDTERFSTILLDQLEWRQTAEGAAGVWEAEGWYGGDYDKLWLRTEGERVGGNVFGD